MVATSASTLHSLVARISRCGECIISGQLVHPTSTGPKLVYVPRISGGKQREKEKDCRPYSLPACQHICTIPFIKSSSSIYISTNGPPLTQSLVSPTTSLASPWSCINKLTSWAHDGSPPYLALRPGI